MSRGCLALFPFLLMVVGDSCPASEVQDHGLAFERLVIRQLTGSEELEKSYTAEWDIPAVANKRTGLPISVKFIEWKNSVYLGDVLRQRTIREPFEMVVGFFQPDAARGRARIVAVHHLTFQPEVWLSWWGTVTEADLRAIIEAAKTGTVAEAQEAARPMAAALRKKSVIFSINPKINKDQRRIQCSIPFNRFYAEVLHQPEIPQERLELFGSEFPGETLWSARPSTGIGPVIR
ncbi:MAG: hypothetical protein SFU85_01595 [Candidatus Methylacidiphilales bacterium]|nr:hypothetical protein [Candidatus Methylacidiphilales bacterium]